MARQRSFVAAAVAVALACVALGPIAGANAGHDGYNPYPTTTTSNSYYDPGYYGPWSGGESDCPTMTTFGKDRACSSAVYSTAGLPPLSSPAWREGLQATERESLGDGTRVCVYCERGLRIPL